MSTEIILKDIAENREDLLDLERQQSGKMPTKHTAKRLEELIQTKKNNLFRLTKRLNRDRKLKSVL